MEIRIVSDLHLEFCEFTLPHIDGDSERTLILAGDICVVDSPVRLKKFIDDVISRFKYVIMVLGNHDYYGGDLNYHNTLIEEYEDYKNFFILQNNFTVLDDTVFIGSTFWTNIPVGTDIGYMNDKRCINKKNSDKKIQSSDWAHEHQVASKFIFSVVENMSFSKDIKNIIVVTHHSPSYKSVDQKFIGDPSNMFYHSNYDNLIKSYPIGLWVHGHTHCFMNYTIKDTRIVCNPRGYESPRYGKEHTGWNPNIIFEINNNVVKEK